MNNSSGTKQTRAVFGCSINSEYVDRDAFRLIKMVTGLLPGVAVTILEPAIRYTVPISQIARPILPNATYHITSEMDGSYIEPRVTQQGLISNPQYSLTVSPDRTKISGISIYHETVERGFSLIPDATFSDARLFNVRTSIEHIGWGKTWTFQFREVYYYPNTSETEKFLFFTKEPRYEIEVTTDGWVEDDIVLNVLEANLPHCFLPNRESRYRPAFVLTTNN